MENGKFLIPKFGFIFYKNNLHGNSNRVGYVKYHEDDHCGNSVTH